MQQRKQKKSFFPFLLHPHSLPMFSKGQRNTVKSSSQSFQQGQRLLVEKAPPGGEVSFLGDPAELLGNKRHQHTTPYFSGASQPVWTLQAVGPFHSSFSSLPLVVSHASLTGVRFRSAPVSPLGALMGVSLGKAIEATEWICVDYLWIRII